MNLYLLTRTALVGYDEAEGFVVRANSANTARKLSAAQAGDEKADTWLKPSESRCHVIGTAPFEFEDPRDEKVILRSFKNG
jgi:hypothetical protein